MTKRKADMVRIAEALGIAPEPGQTASELAERCIDRASELRELAEARADEDEAEAPPAKVSTEERRQQREHESLQAAGVVEPASERTRKRDRKSKRQAAAEVGR